MKREQIIVKWSRYCLLSLLLLVYLCLCPLSPFDTPFLSLFVVNGQPTEIVIKNSSKIVLPHPIGHSNKKEMLSNSNLKIKSEEVEEHNSSPTADDIILSSSCKPDKKKTDHGEKVKVLPPLFDSQFTFGFNCWVTPLKL